MTVVGHFRLSLSHRLPFDFRFAPKSDESNWRLPMR
jgi:hypothetical protein